MADVNESKNHENPEDLNHLTNVNLLNLLDELKDERGNAGVCNPRNLFASENNPLSGVSKKITDCSSAIRESGKIDEKLVPEVVYLYVAEAVNLRNDKRINFHKRDGFDFEINLSEK